MNTQIRSLVLFLVATVLIIGGVVFAMRDKTSVPDGVISSSPTSGSQNDQDQSVNMVVNEYIDKDLDEEGVDDESDVIIPNPGITGGSATAQFPKAVSPYSMADVAVHSTKTSCWTTVGSSVYDVTAWINQHPGGAGAILGLCGKDGTGAFTRQHGGQKQAEAALASFKIGILK